MSRAPTILLVVLAACGEGLDVTPTRAPYDAADIPGCVPNLDGVIEDEELPVVLGLQLSFLVSPAGEERSVAVTPATAPDGAREWNWSQDADTDEQLHVSARALAGRWYAGSYAGGDFVLPLANALGLELEAVYERTSSALWLLGYASTTAAPAVGETLVVYDPPVELVRLPVQPGTRWTSSGVVRNATIRGLPYAGTDTYELEYETSGRLRLPDLLFTQVHQLRTKLTVTPVYGVPYSVRQATFLFECFGEVARATSRLDESQESFTTAAELRRLGL